MNSVTIKITFLFFHLVETKTTEKELFSALKLNHLLLDEDKTLKICQNIQDKISVENAVTFYTLAKLFNLLSANKFSLNYIERCFPMVLETKNFMHLDFNLVAKILASSELNIHSEIEVFNAANGWLKHMSEERSKYSKQLLLKVRFTLLSEHAFKYITDSGSSLNENLKNVETSEEFFKNHRKNKSSSYYTNRYCNQNMFNFLILGGGNVGCYKVKKNSA